MNRAPPPSTFGSGHLCPSVGSHATLTCLERYLLQPLDEGIEQGAERLLRFAVVKCALLVGLDVVRVPPNHETVREDRLVVESLHQRVHVLLLARVELHKVEHHRLDEALDADLAVGLDQLQEGGLVLCPGLDDVALSLENAAEQNVVLVLAGDVHDQLGLAHFLEQVVVRGVLLTDKAVQLADCVH